ncbi:MAG: hypothetical protein KDC95_07845 [Planctomycetes bacterium]|nr:hypothetical protein [Planctomycetota bacterium]
MKVIIGIFVVLALAIAGFAGFIAFDSSTESGAGGAGLRASDALVATISHGERVEFRDHVNNEGLTLFDFTADW